MTDLNLSADEFTSAIAKMVTEKLGASVISSVLPADIGAWIRDSCEHHQMMYSHIIPMRNASCMNMRWMLNPDGTIQQEMADSSGRVFWRGTFRPEETTNADS